MTGGLSFGDFQQMEGIREIATMMRDPSGIAELLTEDHPETGESPADILADIINTTRADNRKIAEAVGVEIEAKRMTPDRAAELLAGTVSGDGIELVVMFNELAEQRATILKTLIEPEEFETFQAQKQAIMYTNPESDSGDD